MNDVMAMVRIQLADEFRIGTAFRSRDGIALLISYLAAASAAVLLEAAALQAFAASGLPDRIPLVSAAAILSAVLGISFLRGGDAFAFERYGMLASMPVPAWKVALARFLSVCIVAWVLALLLALTAALVMVGTSGAWSAAVFVVSVMTASVIPVSAGTALGTAVRHAGAGASRRRLSSILSLALVLAALLAPQILMGGDSLSADALAGMADSLATLCPPAAWVSGAASGSLVASGCVLGTSLVLASMVVYAASMSLQALNDGSGRGYTSARTASRADSRLHSMLRREIDRYLSCTVYLVNTAAGMVVLAAVSVLMVAGGSSDEDLAAVVALLSGCLPFLVAFFIGLSPTTAVSLSLEGESRWILGTAPLSTMDMLLPKILLNLIVLIPLELLSVLVLAAGFGIGGIDLAMLVVLPTAFALLVPVMGMALNVRFPRYEWTSEYYAVKGGSLSMISATGLGMLLSVAPMMVCLLAPGACLWVEAVCAATYLSAAAVLYARLRRTTVHFYRRGTGLRALPLTIMRLDTATKSTVQHSRIRRDVHGNALPRAAALMQAVVCVRGRMPMAVCTGPLMPSRENMVPQRNVIGMITSALNRFRVIWEFASMPDTTPSSPYIRQENTIIDAVPRDRTMSALRTSPIA